MTTNTIHKISKGAIIIVFLALIRCISEVFRQEHYSDTAITYEQVKPFIIGALVSAIGAFIMVVLSFFSKRVFVIATGIITIAVMLWVKMHFQIP